ncbi:ribose 5-phosphate isomerase A [Xanthomarina sp. F2636L]|uniref:ribose 5-phosphate isomerase A n=1 Tax=Xanthomarina sp. F2636L TaxID=2996018 RepID=UPI00225E2195|nr:ribose 5-phosphate isomerase A [Xanthomarina sp. F2636L]MCX7549671.1 ribose 5-phosphate isomerase A [Xanthomarina sp. F2636L]
MKWKNSIGDSFDWGLEITNKEQKEIVAQKIAGFVKNNQTIGIGSGSTVFLSLTHIAKKVKSENLNIKVIPTSFEIELACSSLGLSLTTLKQDKPDWYFDGADEVDPNNNLIKGRGGAMFREKLLLVSSNKNYIIVDETKMVDNLGTNFKVPIEIYPDSINYVRNCLIEMNAIKIDLRIAQKKDGPVITENGNFILDVDFEFIKGNLEKEIKNIVGVVESGLFQNYELTIIKP